jgi:hypothetical protein
LILVRTHGGLGNQLFQAGYAMVLGRQPATPVARLHDNRYRTERAPSPIFVDLDLPVPAWVRALSALRLPKLATRAGLAVESWSLGEYRLLDGYFQDPRSWAELPGVHVRWFLDWLRERLGIDPARTGGDLVHLRLGDFFVDEEAERAHVAERVATLPEGAIVISNRDDLLAANSAELSARGVRHQRTDAMDPEALIALMAGFRIIRSNDSTLALWAGILGRGRTSFSDGRLRALDAAIRAHEG